MTKLNRMQFDAKLEEYRQLQEAIRQLRVRQDRDIYFMFVVFIGIISLGFRLQYSILYMTSSFVLLYLWLDEIRIFDSIHRLNTYIEVFIEQEIDELRHSTKGGEHCLHTQKIPKLLRALANGIIPLLSLVFFILARCYWDSLIPNMSYTKSITIYWIYLHIFSISFGSLFFWSIRSTNEGRNREMKEWKRIKNLQNEKNNL